MILSEYPVDFDSTCESCFHVTEQTLGVDVNYFLEVVGHKELLDFIVQENPNFLLELSPLTKDKLAQLGISVATTGGALN